MPKQSFADGEELCAAPVVVVPERQYFPLPYIPSREAATWVSSATSLGSVGVPLRRRSLNLRARSGGRSVSWSKRRASTTILLLSRANRSEALAEMASVSSVMLVSWSQEALAASLPSASRSASALSMKALASAAVGLAWVLHAVNVATGARRMAASRKG